MQTTLPPAERTRLEPAGSPAERHEPHTDGVFRSASDRAAMIAMYDAKLAQWPVPFEELDVKTSYGNTHIVASGRLDAPPVLLLHMAACSSFIWAPVIEAFAASHRVFAVDMIGDVNKSVLESPTHYPKTGDALAAWLCEVADALGLEQSDVIAGSYGGWLGMHYAIHAPQRVRRLVLVVPMGLPTWIQTARVLVRLSTITLGLSAAKMERVLSYLLGDDPSSRRLAGDWFAEVFARKCRMRVPSPKPVSNSQLEAIRAPTLIVLGGRDPLIGNAERAARRARAHIPDVEVEIVPNGTHAVHAEEPTRVAANIVEFLRATGEDDT